jgi:hypothetical protein
VTVLAAGCGGGGSSPGVANVGGSQQKCARYSPGKGAAPSPAQQTQVKAKLLAFAQSMRANGVHDFPHPRISVPSNPFGSGTRVISDIEGVILVFGSTIDEQSPAFTRAAAACTFPLHNH